MEQPPDLSLFPERVFVFVYGTLRRGGSNALRMARGHFLGSGTVGARLYAISWYPGLVVDDCGPRVVGDLYAVGPEHLRDLDEYEGLAAGEIEGSEYRRVRTLMSVAPAEGVAAGTAKEVEVWVWEWKGLTEEGKRIASGDWLDFQAH